VATWQSVQWLTWSPELSEMPQNIWDMCMGLAETKQGIWKTCISLVWWEGAQEATAFPMLKWQLLG